MIFQYLTKTLHNISLIEILLLNNEVLCFALSLISKTIYGMKYGEKRYGSALDFYYEVACFLECFDNKNRDKIND